MSYLKDFCEIITKGTTPSTYGYSFKNSGIKFIRSENITDSRIISKVSLYISKEANEKLKRSILLKDDVLMSIAGAYLGKLALITEMDLPANTNQAVAIIRTDKSKLNPLYLYYYLSSYKMQCYINNVNAQSAQPNINLQQIGDININVPSLNYQQHIVDIIGSLDDKIESNNKIIEKIDKLGLSKYKKIKNDFIDFNDFANFEKGKEASSQNYMSEKNNENINFIRVKDLNSLTDTYISKTLDIPVAKPNDVLISFDGAIGRINYGLVGAYSSGIYKVIPKFTNDYGILYWSLKDNTNQQIMLEHTNGTTILHGSKSIKYLKIKKHLQDDIDYFNKIFDYSLNIKLQNKKLCELKKLYLKKFFG